MPMYNTQKARRWGEKKEPKILIFLFVYPFKKHSYYFQPELAAFGHSSEHTYGVLWTTKQV